MLNPSKKSFCRPINVGRRNRNAYETGKVDLNDVLQFVEYKATPIQLRAVQIALLGKHIAPPEPGQLAIANIERFILTSNKTELRRIEAATKERRAG